MTPAAAAQRARDEPRGRPPEQAAPVHGYSRAQPGREPRPAELLVEVGEGLAGLLQLLGLDLLLDLHLHRDALVELGADDLLPGVGFRDRELLARVREADAPLGLEELALLALLLDGSAGSRVTGGCLGPAEPRARPGSAESLGCRARRAGRARDVGGGGGLRQILVRVDLRRGRGLLPRASGARARRCRPGPGRGADEGRSTASSSSATFTARAPAGRPRTAARARGSGSPSR